MWVGDRLLGAPSLTASPVHAPQDVTASAFQRPGREDLRTLIRLAIPVVTVQVGMMLMGVADTMLELTETRLRPYETLMQPVYR